MKPIVKNPRKQITRPCLLCEVPVTRCQSQMLDHVFCSRKCSRQWNSIRFSFLNQEWNAEKMTLEIRTKIREKLLGKGEGLTYEKTFSRHTHRVVAEQMLGRKLLKGEVVHHIDENIRNNDPSNLKVFSSQAEHAAHHQSFKKC